MPVLTNLATALSATLVIGASACGDTAHDSAARRRAATLLHVSAAKLRITERTDLSFGDAVFLRATSRDDPRRTVTVVIGDGRVLDETMPDAFDTLATHVHAARDMEALGADRIAGWFGALGGGGVCGEPLPGDRGAAQTSATPDPDGGQLVRYLFASDVGGVRRCVVDLAPNGAVRRVDADLTMAKK